MLESEGFSKSELAFELAIEEGRLSDDEYADNYAGLYMFMGHHGGKDLFKNIQSRKYDV